MKRKVFLSALLLLCVLAVAPVMAGLDILNQDPPEFLIVGTSTTSLNVNYGDNSGLIQSLQNAAASYSITQTEYNKLLSPVISSFDVVYYQVLGQSGGGPRLGKIICHINCVGAPEPTPEGAYLTSTLLSESNTGLTYQIKPMPDDGTYLFSRVNTGNPSAVDSTIIYSSEDAAINYIIGRGTSQTFYCNYKEGYWGLPHTMSITLSAPIYSDDVLINATIINNTLQNIPNPINPNPTTNNNAFVSGAWSPIGRDAVVSSAFGDIVRNGGIVFSLPHMASPEELRAGLLNNTGNITAPLYDYIDSASGMVLFLPDILANAVGTVLNGISETVSIIKDYIGYLFGLLNNCMDFFYILLPIVYVLIPDAVWWCFSALLCYFIIKWILILILGYDVISAYLTDSKEGDKK